MIPCISNVCTLPSALPDEITEFSAAGFPAIELWLTKLEKTLQSQSIAEIEKRLADAPLKPAAASLQGGLFRRELESRKLAWELFRSRLGILQQLQVPVIIIAADLLSEDLMDPGHSLEMVLESLTQIGDLVAQHAMSAAIEFHPRSAFMTNLATLNSLLEVLDHPALGVCFDTFHFETGPSKLADLANTPTAYLKHVQIADFGETPREFAEDRERILPGDGVCSLGPIMDLLRNKNYNGPISLELNNPLLWRIPAIQVATAGWGSLQRLGLLERLG
jgi:2-keto-myo-inositol isomerase